ncbi:MAG TPA: aminotransferase class I/II-fold pyridoxal phosphate-dependent enzyme [Jiangellaceae bacterium]|nr:aminotransferase class I/II-fold pyridoxal phosphate-dependent enzyme [Jiangellaceae bacterium]
MANPLQALSLGELRQRTSAKWRVYPSDVLPAWIAEMDVPLAEPVTRAVTDAIAIGDTGYPYGTIYAEALAEFAEARWGWEIDVGRSAIVPDVMLGIVEVLKLITNDDDAVVVNSPVYTPFYQFVSNMGRRVMEAPLDAAHRIDLTTLEAAFERATAGGRPAAFLLCSPHNPTGTVHTREELLAVIELADRYQVRLVVDEIHAPVVHADAMHVPFLTLPGSAASFALLSASKAWNLAGLKAAVVVAGADAGGELAQMPEEVSHGPSHVGILAHCAALREGGDWLDQVLAGLEENRHLLANLLAAHLPGVRYTPPEGTYLAWLDCRDLDLGDDPAATFLRKGRVALNSGPSFGSGGAGHARLNLATSPELLTEAVRRMASSQPER